MCVLREKHARHQGSMLYNIVSQLASVILLYIIIAHYLSISHSLRRQITLSLNVTRTQLISTPQLFSKYILNLIQPCKIKIFQQCVSDIFYVREVGGKGALALLITLKIIFVWDIEINSTFHLDLHV